MTHDKAICVSKRDKMPISRDLPTSQMAFILGNYFLISKIMKRNIFNFRSEVITGNGSYPYYIGIIPVRNLLCDDQNDFE